MTRIRWWLYAVRYRLKFVLTGDCGHACDYLHPWGFVPEEECPVHNLYPLEPPHLWVSTPSGEGLVGEVKPCPKP